MAKKKILTDNGQEILPITHESCVLDNNGVSIGSKIGNINELATDSRTDLVSAINDVIYYKNTIKQENEELKQEKENIRDILAGLMQEGGYDITGEEDITTLLDLLEISGINIIDVKQIACGYNHTVLLKNDGSVWSCGANANGELGLANNTGQKIFTQATTNINNDVKQVFCGNHYTFILKNDGSIWSCGLNANGQLGLGDNTDRTTFTQVTTNINNDVKQISCGYYHTFILKNDGSIWSCGHNNYGQLGLGDNTNRTTFTQVTTNINNDVEQTSCGDGHTIILKNDGSIWSCGYNYYGQLGLGTSDDTINHNKFTQVTTNINNDVKQIACGRYFDYVLKNDGSVWSCGYNANGRLGLGDTTNRTTFTQVTTNINNDVKQISCGTANHHVFILKNDGSLYGCGYNNYGQLGCEVGSYNVFTELSSDKNNKQVACGGHHTFILKNDGSVWSCGYNSDGQLGLGTSDSTSHTLVTQITTNILSSF